MPSVRNSEYGIKIKSTFFYDLMPPGQPLGKWFHLATLEWNGREFIYFQDMDEKIKYLEEDCRSTLGGFRSFAEIEDEDRGLAAALLQVLEVTKLNEFILAK